MQACLALQGLSRISVPRSRHGRSRGDRHRPENLALEACAALAEQLPENRAMAARFILAIAADRQIGFLRKAREQLEQALRCGRPHLAAVSACESGPVAITRILDEAGKKREAGC